MKRRYTLTPHRLATLGKRARGWQLLIEQGMAVVFLDDCWMDDMVEAKQGDMPKRSSPLAIRRRSS